MIYNNRFFVVDVETGGLPLKDKREAFYGLAITQIAIVVVDNETLTIIDDYSSIIKPYKDDLYYSPEAIKLTGFDKNYCETNGKDLNDVIDDLLRLIKLHTLGRRKPILAGHNIIDFDGEWIEKMFAFKKINVAKLFDKSIIDTLELSRLKYISAPKFRLSNCCELANVTLEDAHDALQDTKATAMLLISLIKSLRNDSNVAINNNVSPRDGFSL